MSFITGPLQARALGPTGRGELAAILIPAGLVPTIVSLGLGSYAMWAAARGRNLGTLLGTVGSMLLVLGVIAALVGIPLSRYLGGGSDVVTLYLTIAFLAVPVTLLALLVTDLAIGLEQWPTVIAARLAVTLAGSVAIVVLFIAGVLTVSSAAIVGLSAGIFSLIPMMSVLRRRPALSFDRAMARAALRFGAKAWVGGVTYVTNLRLDQLLMIKMVSARDLGLYAIAVNLSGFFLSPLLAALLQGSSPRIAKGDHELPARIGRLSVAATVGVGLPIAAVSPMLLPALFGTGFAGALPATLVLLAASVPAALNGALCAAVSSAGHPGLAARAQALALMITVPGLLLALPPLGIIGAALVSFVAYSTTTVYIVERAHQLFGGRRRDYVVPRTADMTELLVRGASKLTRVWRTRRRRPA